MIRAWLKIRRLFVLLFVLRPAQRAVERARARFETAANTLAGLLDAYQHHQAGHCPGCVGGPLLNVMVRAAGASLAEAHEAYTATLNRAALLEAGENCAP